MEGLERELEYYRTADGRFPFREWHAGLKDHRAQALVDIRLARIRVGNFGFCRPVGDGVLELKIDFGPGYRVYLAPVGPRIILLLGGGDKSTQGRDIRLAKGYRREYKARQR